MLFHWIEAFHIISVVSWMCGMLYLPRLFVYHSDENITPETSKVFKTMERRLIKIIINPAMISTIVFGITLAYLGGAYMEKWFHVKVTLVLIMTMIHGFLIKQYKKFRDDKNTYSKKQFIVINESIALLMGLIIICAVVKPF